MTLQTLANLGEFVGGLMVVLSVIYLALQIRQNTRSQLTQNYTVALDRIAEFQSRMSEAGEFSDILVTGTQDPSHLTQQQRVQFTWAFYEMFGAFEFMFHQERSGAMPREVWARWADTLQWWLSFPGVAAWWDARPTPFTAAFSEFVESRRGLGPPDAEAQQRWITFLAGR